MIIVKLMGGLGNQMFQYAAGRALSEKNSISLKLDLSFLEDRTSKGNFTFRDFELGCFETAFEIAKDLDLRVFKPKTRIVKAIMKFSGENLPTHYYEHHFNYNEAFEQLRPPTLLEGYFQTEKYFSSIRHILLQEFKWKPVNDSLNLKVLGEIRDCNSVSVHVRRGDYVSNFVINSYHGVCDVKYYKDAIGKMSNSIDNPRFFVFSDDMAWAKAEFKDTPSVQFIDHNSGARSYIDMMLMSKCKHNIIANSSFSWWSAWLNTHSEKTVIAPKVWFADSDKNKLTKDLIPAGWIRL